MGREVQDEHFDIFKEITIVRWTILANKSSGTKKTLDNLKLLFHDFRLLVKIFRCQNIEDWSRQKDYKKVHIFTFVIKNYKHIVLIGQYLEVSGNICLENDW